MSHEQEGNASRHTVSGTSIVLQLLLVDAYRVQPSSEEQDVYILIHILAFFPSLDKPYLRPQDILKLCLSILEC